MRTTTTTTPRTPTAVIPASGLAAPAATEAQPVATPAVGAPSGEQLATGWEPDVPAHDTLVRRYLAAWARMCQAFAGAAGGRTVWTPRFAATDHGRPASFFTSATLLRPPAPGEFEATLEEVERFYAGGRGDVHLWSAWPTPDLRPRGWHLVGHPPLLVRPPIAVQSPTTAGAKVDEVRDAPGLADWEQVAVEGYPMPELAPFRPGQLLDPAVLDDRRLHFSLGYDRGRPVSLGALYTDLPPGAGAAPPVAAGGAVGGAAASSLGAAIRGIGVFALGVTLPEVRGRGHWRAHAEHRLRLAPDVWMTGVFSDYSRSPAERLGFVPVVRLTLWARTR